MTTQEKIAKAKLSILELAEYLKNVSEACRINGVSRHFPCYQDKALPMKLKPSLT